MRNGCSDRLYNAEAGSLTPVEVLDLYDGQIEEELGDSGDPEIDRSIERSRQEMKAAASEARALLEQLPQEEAIEAMLTSENEMVVSIGEALESEDYSAICI